MSNSIKSSSVTENTSCSAKVLSVLLDKGHCPRRTTTGINSVQYKHLDRQGSLYSIKAGTPAACSSDTTEEAYTHLCTRLHPLTSNWCDKDRAVLALRLRGMSVRGIKENIGVGADRICAVIRKVREYLDDK